MRLLLRESRKTYNILIRSAKQMGQASNNDKNEETDGDKDRDRNKDGDRDKDKDKDKDKDRDKDKDEDKDKDIRLAFRKKLTKWQKIFNLLNYYVGFHLADIINEYAYIMNGNVLFKELKHKFGFAKA
ncbi:hypothetical protein MBM_08928 [Drepanopeziza brunnea f. sp. 'multigermtubi' MB_m1]|uniref:Uncharacterized protein n=1 Tax=Marssonina brunnea f. sp. multigermtubi (strain MB_m1) TaxID=1072389 RepID=K1XKH7_MARBU|nr:uncharacterized protein MBM_08928 [Drepanopeziza brunnea f. sp. 'multigermtubi' MB_m1]EKD12974.1 hypothetical protein MBM_08928 [Drepanopeziza brunnea f. sp. 'multigermtubi' MB_m1]